MRTRPHALATVAILGAFAALLTFATVSTGQESTAADRSDMLNDGSLSYNRFCQSCHGDRAKGDGSVAEFLTVKPADLTRISARRGGEFPTEEIHKIVDGREGVRAHGQDMPIWGDAFQRTEETADEEVIQRKIAALVYYLESIQERISPAAERTD